MLRLALLLIAFGTPVMAQTVGVASATSGEPRGTLPAQNERILRVGVDVFANERVRTGANDRAHLVFTDGSALSIGVNSELTIDHFVYDPNTRQGDLSMTASRGAFRFVGGAISKKSEVKVSTPSGNIGIRGGIATISIGNDGSTTITFLYGDSATVSNPAGTQKATRAGSARQPAGLSRPVRAAARDRQCRQPGRPGPARCTGDGAQHPGPAADRNGARPADLADLPAAPLDAGDRHHQRQSHLGPAGTHEYTAPTARRRRWRRQQPGRRWMRQQLLRPCWRIA
jgi:hypothetical protein